MTRALQQVGIQEPQGQAAGKGLTRQRTSQQLQGRLVPLRRTPARLMQEPHGVPPPHFRI
eukprot:CAMPEP_0114419284 /NCGR_PEP_ID=MMETSP0103-20121206/3943_2 /TAXON_ID=37642 ORGANISM="Paraphysomonas imperforata, Strain PA2" /NCGR_SAMPLE_ID=MMETSP0103 /ASSEMBLY_ACC=CAM_ASM_000201 /LENGTH=59 /DNA_ID=CAMNT_0001587689 /DNA_START=860 /DNA_END=1039 /DNA_ORIENTATION=-